MSEFACYHCGLPLPEDLQGETAAALQVTIAGSPRQMCCMGCAAVATAIVDNGLVDYYRTRDAMPESPREARPSVLDQLVLFDHADFQRTFVRSLAEHEREAALMLEGITCSACIWLNEQHIAGLPGVLAVDINYASRRAKIRWDDSKIKLSAILKAVQAIGYNAHPYDATRTEQLAQKERRTALWRLWVAGFGMMQVMMYAYPAYIAEPGDITDDINSLMRWASLILTLPVVIYSAAPFFRFAWRDIKLRRVGMDVPVALGIGAAFAASVWATLINAGEVYFDSVTMFVFFLLGGRYLEMMARQQAVSVTESLAKLQPAFAERVLDYPAKKAVEQVMVADLHAGDVLMVRPGATIPADGVVVEGVSHADEALLTGESRPVSKKMGDELTGGSTNMDSPLFMRVTRVGEETRLSSIVQLMERAGTEKPRLVELADRVATRFVALLLVLAAAVGVAWYFIDPSQAFWITVSVLVVTCPCALSLATPVALTVAAGSLAKDGLLVTRGHAVETLSRATHFVFDKTGTLTTGQMALQVVQVVDDRLGGQVECQLLAAGLENASEHPIAKALRAAVLSESPLPVFEDARVAPGLGVEGRLAGKCFRVGQPAYVAALSESPVLPITEGWLEKGFTVVALGDSEGVLAYFALGDTIRPEAEGLVRYIQNSGHRVSLLTGDALAVANYVAKALNISDVQAGVSPAQKHAYVQALQANGAVVAMVGDGVNDAPVLAQAQVSIAMGAGAQLARAQADIVLLSENLHYLAVGLKRARFSFKIIRQNLWWSFTYNFVALPLAMVGYVTPWMAGIGMSVSSLLVVLNSLRIQKLQGPA